MNCPRCGDQELIVILEEAMGVWYQCPKCHGEIIRPDPEAHPVFHPISIDGKH